MARKSDFVSESRSLATDFVKQSDRYRSLAQEFAFGGYAAAPEAGGLSDEDRRVLVEFSMLRADDERLREGARVFHVASPFGSPRV